MKEKAIYILLCYHILTRAVTEYLDSDILYYLLDAAFIGAIGCYVYSYSEKSVFSLLSLLLIVLLSVNQAISTIFYMLEDDYMYYLPTLSKILIGLGIYVLIFHNRYDWRKQKSAEYDPSKVQAIYSKPNTILTLIGATVSLSPRCSVRYCYGGETIRFKKSSRTPLKQPTLLKDTDIIEDLDHDGDYFNARWKEIKGKEYNLLTFNCKSLLDGGKG